MSFSGIAEMAFSIQRGPSAEVLHLWTMNPGEARRILVKIMMEQKATPRRARTSRPTVASDAQAREGTRSGESPGSRAFLLSLGTKLPA